jgi:hypothetical protein
VVSGSPDAAGCCWLLLLVLLLFFCLHEESDMALSGYPGFATDGLFVTQEAGEEVRMGGNDDFPNI